MEILLKIKTSSAEETENVGFEFAKKLAPGDCIAMKGDLGAGKTALTRGIAAGLGIGEQVVRNQLSSAMKKIREYLLRYMPLIVIIYKVLSECMPM